MANTNPARTPLIRTGPDCGIQPAGKLPRKHQRLNFSFIALMDCPQHHHTPPPHARRKAQANRLKPVGPGTPYPGEVIHLLGACRYRGITLFCHGHLAGQSCFSFGIRLTQFGRSLQWEHALCTILTTNPFVKGYSDCTRKRGSLSVIWRYPSELITCPSTE